MTCERISKIANIGPKNKTPPVITSDATLFTEVTVTMQ